MKKMFFVALVMSFALAACGGKKKTAPANPTPETGSAMGSDTGSAAGSGDTGSAAGGGGGSGM
ncbi:MAG TPA: hypothetical protein VFQ53_14470 [Kofleriaceae bacterium]|nr:hypothetical protein [Kofleriaceae bacterium]